MSRLFGFIIYFILLIGLAIISFLSPMFWYPTGCLFIVYLIALSMDIPDIISFKYRIIDKKYQIEVDYLTLNFIFMPVWKPIEKEPHSYESQNIFGADETHFYSSPIYYENMKKVEEGINQHKEKIKRNRKEFVEKGKKEKFKVTYRK